MQKQVSFIFLIVCEKRISANKIAEVFGATQRQVPTPESREYCRKSGLNNC